MGVAKAVASNDAAQTYIKPMRAAEELIACTANELRIITVICSCSFSANICIGSGSSSSSGWIESRGGKLRGAVGNQAHAQVCGARCVQHRKCVCSMLVIEGGAWGRCAWGGLGVVVNRGGYPPPPPPVGANLLASNVN